MSDGVQRVDVDAIRARCEAANDIVRRLCLSSDQQLRLDWRMSSPARPDSDPDLVIGRALHDVPALLDALAAAQQRAAALEAALRLLAADDGLFTYTIQPDYRVCMLCDGLDDGAADFRHADDCPYMQAHALLADAAPATREE